MITKTSIGLIPILLIYLAVTMAVGDKKLEKDEIRYAAYANNLSEGFYTNHEDPYLWNGPGYPLVLTPFAKFGIAWKWARILNSFFLFSAVCIVYVILKQYTNPKMSLLASWVFGLYLPMWTEMPQLYTESLSIFLVAAFSLFFIRYFKNKLKSDMMLAGLFCGYLILTKVIFAYVALFGLVFALIWSLKKRQALKIAVIYLIAFACTVPYLLYTHHLTGKLFYWTNAGGTTLYCMANPNLKEYGDWKAIFSTMGPEKHPEIHKQLQGLSYVEQDELLKQKALQMIREDPKAYFHNYLCNLGRLWFNYPFSYKQQRPHTLVYTVPNSLLFSGLLMSVLIFWRQRKKVPIEISALIVFSLLFLGGSSLIYACGRRLFPVIPILTILIFYAATNLITISLKETTPSEIS